MDVPVSDPPARGHPPVSRTRRPVRPGEHAVQFVVIALALLVGPVLYFTPYWRPVLYLLGAGFAVYLGAIWLLGGMEYLPLGVVTSVTATGFVLLAVYLFYREETASGEP